jgi:hypothetical protein
LEKFYRDQRETNGLLSPAPSSKGGEGEALAPVEVVMISKGEPKENHAKVKEHGLTFPVVLQQQWEISRRYAMFATPIAYAINEAGVIQADVAVGLDAILGLMSEEAQAPQPRVACRAHDSRNYFDAGAGEFVAGPWNERSTRLCGSLGAGTTTWP